MHGGKNIPLLIIPLTWGGASPSSAVGSNSTSAISCCRHAAGETVFCKDFPSGSRVLRSLLVRGDQAGVAITSHKDPLWG